MTFHAKWSIQRFENIVFMTLRGVHAFLETQSIVALKALKGE